MGASRRLSGGIALAIVCLAISAYFVRSVPEIGGDGRLAFVYAVVDHASAAVDPYVREEPEIRQDLASVGGHDYMAKPPLPALLAIPPYALLRLVFPPAHMDSWLWRWILTLIVSGGSLAAMALLVRELARERHLPSPALAGVAAAIGTPLLVYSSLLMAHSLAAALVASAALISIKTPLRPMLLGLLVGSLVSVDLIAAVAGLVPLAYGVVRLCRARDAGGIVRIGLGGVAGTLPLFLYQAVVFGSPIASMYADLVDPQQRAAYATLRIGLPPPDVVLALLFSPRNGLLIVAPIALVGSVLLVRLARSIHRRDVVLIAGLSAVAMLFGLAALPRDLVFWFDRAEWGPRLLVSLLPLVCWPLATLSSRALAILIAVASVPQLVALSLLRPMLAPEAPVQLVDAFRHFVSEPATPSLLGAMIPSPIPFRMEATAAALVVGVAATLVLIARHSEARITA